MKFFKPALIAIMLAALTSGCSTYSLEKLRNTTPKGNAFQNALAKHYMDFATLAEKNYDWPNSWYFADKGLLAAYGQEVGPEDLKEWDIPEDKVLELEKSRAALLAVLTDANIAKQPDVAAKAQFSFDCWVKNQEQRWQLDKIAECRDAFNEALAQLDGTKPAEAANEDMAVEAKDEAVVPPSAPMPAPAPTTSISSEEAAAAGVAVAPKAETKLHLAPGKTAAVVAAPATAAVVADVAPKAPPAATVSYVVFFEWGEANLTSAGEKVVDDVVKTLSSQTGYEVVLKGHTDTSEPKNFNMKLSQQRANTVKARLVAGGVPEDAIRMYVFGEKDQAVKTEDGVKEPANRRVEIFLND